MSCCHSAYIEILREELIPAQGCTEPIAIAYAASVARQTLGAFPDYLTVGVSGNIVKNVKGVIVPGTTDLKGIAASALLGVIGGNHARELEVLRDITPQHVQLCREMLQKKDFYTVERLTGEMDFHIIIRLASRTDTCEVEMTHTHTHINKITKNDQVIRNNDKGPGKASLPFLDRLTLTIADIYKFANTVEIDQIKPLIQRQIDYNYAIAKEGLSHPYGACVGKTILENSLHTPFTRAKAYAAAGSDARMSGCPMPVVINSGSGNQGIAVSLPVISYCRDKGLDFEVLIRALALSNLISIHQKAGIGRLSAYCGAVSAGCAAGCGIAYADGAPLSVIEATIVNTLGNIAGMVCDGAKPSCAAKIVSAIDASILGYQMAKNGRTFRCGEGVIKENIEDTISAFSRMGRNGMKSTDDEIINIMLEH